MEDQDQFPNDKCGRCGCTRKDHTPACITHPLKCKKFSDPRPHKKKSK